MGRRPAAGEPRRDRIEIRLLPEERAGLEAAAKAAGLTASQWARMVLIERMRKGR